MPRSSKGVRKTPRNEWALNHLAAILGTHAQPVGRYVNGLSYPQLQMMQKIEIVFGWPVREQVDLIPPYWEWPLQDDRVNVQPTDLRYGMKLRQVMQEWGEANPRTEKTKDLRMHPKLVSRQGRPL